jgi:hypothetical protein
MPMAIKTLLLKVIAVFRLSAVRPAEPLVQHL